MTPAEAHILQWLRTQAARRDRVLADAVNMGVVLSIETVPESGWRVRVRSKRGVEHRLVIRQHPVTSEPTHYYREREEQS
ncbi:MAG: hypothetical protein ABFD89_12730 [Bryobacteraceae bacterium]